MKKVKYLLIAIGIILVILLINKACSASQTLDFKENSFAHEVRSVEDIEGVQKITYKDLSSMSFSGLNFKNEEMKPYKGMEFSEFIHPGDSIFKEAGSLILRVKPANGDSFELDVN